MVANEEGEWRELEPGPPLPHFLLCFYTRFWKELGGGMAPRPKVGEGSCWLLYCWSPLSGMSWARELLGTQYPSCLSPHSFKERSGDSLMKNLWLP